MNPPQNKTAYCFQCQTNTLQLLNTHTNPLTYVCTACTQTAFIPRKCSNRKCRFLIDHPEHLYIHNNKYFCTECYELELSKQFKDQVYALEKLR